VGGSDRRLSLVPASLLPPDDPTKPLPRTARDWIVDVVLMIIGPEWVC